MFRKRCQHRFVERERMYSPPFKGWGLEISGFTTSAMERLLSGTTTIVNVCEHCGILNTYEIKGKVME